MNLWDQELSDTLDQERIRRARRQKRRCQHKGCVNGARRVQRDWQDRAWVFCDRHAAGRAEHDRVVERILEIPCRPR